jgi:hypothetical protein
MNNCTARGRIRDQKITGIKLPPGDAESYYGFVLQGKFIY